jgi:hypothetical protein
MKFIKFAGDNETTIWIRRLSITAVEHCRRDYFLSDPYTPNLRRSLVLTEARTFVVHGSPEEILERIVTSDLD